MWQKEKLPLQERAKVASGNAAASYALKFEPVKVGEMWEVENLSFRDNTSATTRIEVYIEGGGWNHFVGQKLPGVSTTVYTLPMPFWVGEGRTLVVEFVGGGATDELEAWATGWKRVEGEE